MLQSREVKPLLVTLRRAQHLVSRIFGVGSSTTHSSKRVFQNVVDVKRIFWRDVKKAFVNTDSARSLLLIVSNADNKK